MLGPLRLPLEAQSLGHDCSVDDTLLDLLEVGVFLCWIMSLHGRVLPSDVNARHFEL